MITHNGTYLLHATHHGMPIFAATMGGKMVIGYGLLSATLQAIVAAFGAEGTEVIAKTNDYLNRITTTDPQRALLLAGFINEDPMLVCSLVETSKTRWLVGDGVAWIATTFIPAATDLVKYQFMPLAIGEGNASICGARNKAGTGGTGSYNDWIINNQLRVDWASSSGATYANGVILENGNAYEVESKKGLCIVNGKQAYKGTVSSEVLRCPLYLFTVNNEGEPAICAKIGFGYLLKEGSIHLVPFIRNGENGMLDIISGTFYPNANTQGSFTIALTDKTTETTS